VIAVIVLTYNRAHLLPRCVEDVLLRASEATREIVVWNNGSDDETREYLDTIDSPRIRVVHHDTNIGTNAYARAVELTSSPYIVGVDDDVIEAPSEWDRTLLDAFLKIPNIGYLMADLKEDPHDSAYQYLKYAKEVRKVYTRREVDGVTILEGPTGSGCAMTSREIYERVGGFGEHKKLVFWHEDAAYVRSVLRHGYRTAILEDLQVWHAGSPYYSEWSPAKIEFHDHHRRLTARKDMVKKALLRIPFVASLNERHKWFGLPDEYRPPRFREDARDDPSPPG
jgi:GT2 family glycosyltransferase